MVEHFYVKFDDHSCMSFFDKKWSEKTDSGENSRPATPSV